jgi:hypothetical protein
VDTYRKLVQANPLAYLPAVTQTLNNLAILELAQDGVPAVIEKVSPMFHMYADTI